MDAPTYSPRRRAAIELGLATVALLATSGAVRVLLTARPPRPVAIALAVVPVVPLGFVLRAVLRRFRELDELQRRVQLEALAFSFAATAFITITYSYLSQFAGFPRLDVVWVWPIQGTLWSLGVVVGTRRYCR